MGFYGYTCTSFGREAIQANHEAALALHRSNKDFLRTLEGVQQDGPVVVLLGDSVFRGPRPVVPGLLPGSLSPLWHVDSALNLILMDEEVPLRVLAPGWLFDDYVTEILSNRLRPCDYAVFQDAGFAPRSAWSTYHRMVALARAKPKAPSTAPLIVLTTWQDARTPRECRWDIPGADGFSANEALRRAVLTIRIDQPCILLDLERLDAVALARHAFSAPEPLQEDGVHLSPSGTMVLALALACRLGLSAADERLLGHRVAAEWAAMPTGLRGSAHFDPRGISGLLSSIREAIEAAPIHQEATHV